MGNFNRILKYKGADDMSMVLQRGMPPVSYTHLAEEEGIVITGLIGSRAYCGLPPTEPVLEKMGEFGFTLQDLACLLYTSLLSLLRQ